MKSSISSRTKVVFAFLFLASIPIFFLCSSDSDAARFVNQPTVLGQSNDLKCTVADFLDAGAYTHCLADYEMTPGPNSEINTGKLMVIGKNGVPEDWTPIGVNNVGHGACVTGDQVTIDGCDASPDAACLRLAFSNGDASTPCVPQWDASSLYDASSITQVAKMGFFQEPPGVNRYAPYAVEVEARFPNGAGSHPIAINTYPIECQSPNVNTAFGLSLATPALDACVVNNEQYGEEDLDERIFGPSTNFWNTVHSAHCDQHLQACQQEVNGSPDYGTQWHKYVLASNYDRAGIGDVTFYRDQVIQGVPLRSGFGGDLPDGNIVTGCGSSGYLPPMKKFLAWSLIVGDCGGCTYTAADLPQVVEVNYIRVACRNWDGQKCNP